MPVLEYHALCFSLALGRRSCPRPYGMHPAHAHIRARWPVRSRRSAFPGASIPPPQSRTEALRQSTHSDPHASAVAVVEAVCGRPVRAATPRCSGGSWPRSTVLHRPGYSAPPPSPGDRGPAVVDVEPPTGRPRSAVPFGPTDASQRPGVRSSPILTSRGSLQVWSRRCHRPATLSHLRPVVSSGNRIAIMCHECPRCVERRPRVRPGKKSNPGAVGGEGKSPPFLDAAGPAPRPTRHPRPRPCSRGRRPRPPQPCPVRWGSDLGCGRPTRRGARLGLPLQLVRPA